MKNWKYYIIGSIMLLVATLQLIRSNTSDFSRWRGGGFGMYSEMHWNQREIWFQNVPSELDVLVTYAIECDRIRRNPSDSQLESLAKKINDKHGIRDFYIELWGTRFDRDSHQFSKYKINEVYFK